MKDTELKKLIEGKDLTKPEDFQAVLAGINKNEDAIDIKKTNTFNEKYTALEDAKNKEIQSLKNRAYVYKNINNKMDDESMNEFMAMIDYKMSGNAKLKFEDAASSLYKKWGPKESTPQEAVPAKKEEVVEIPKQAKKPVEKVEEEEVESEVNYGVRAQSNASLDVDYSDRSDAAQLARYNKFIGKK